MQTLTHSNRMEDKIDWDRKNRLRVYEAVYFISTRRLQKAAQHFLDTLATFSAVELLDYETYIYYTILSSVFAFDRVTLHKKVRKKKLIKTTKKRNKFIPFFLLLFC